MLCHVGFFTLGSPFQPEWISKGASSKLPNYYSLWQERTLHEWWHLWFSNGPHWSTNVELYGDIMDQNQRNLPFFAEQEHSFENPSIPFFHGGSQENASLSIYFWLNKRAMHQHQHLPRNGCLQRCRCHLFRSLLPSTGEGSGEAVSLQAWLVGFEQKEHGETRVRHDIWHCKVLQLIWGL